MELKRTAFLVFLAFITVITFGQNNPDNSNGSVFEKVEVEANYPGGDQAWIKFLEKNLNANVPVKNGAPIGKYSVYVQFVVNTDGSISDIKPLTKLGYGMEGEVVQLLKKSGGWTPALVDGKPVKAYRKQPVTFMVIQDNIQVSSQAPYALIAGADNEITIDAYRVKNEDLNVTITKGTIKKTTDGRFIAKVKGTGRAIMTVYGKKEKKIADVSFEIQEQ